MPRAVSWRLSGLTSANSRRLALSLDVRRAASSSASAMASKLMVSGTPPPSGAGANTAGASRSAVLLGYTLTRHDMISHEAPPKAPAIGFHVNINNASMLAFLAGSFPDWE